MREKLVCFRILWIGDELDKNFAGLGDSEVAQYVSHKITCAGGAQAIIERIIYQNSILPYSAAGFAPADRA